MNACVRAYVAPTCQLGSPKMHFRKQRWRPPKQSVDQWPAGLARDSLITYCSAVACCVMLQDAGDLQNGVC